MSEVPEDTLREYFLATFVRFLILHIDALASIPRSAIFGGHRDQIVLSNQLTFIAFLEQF